MLVKYNMITILLYSKFKKRYKKLKSSKRNCSIYNYNFNSNDLMKAKFKILMLLFKF